MQHEEICSRSIHLALESPFVGGLVAPVSEAAVQGGEVLGPNALWVEPEIDVAQVPTTALVSRHLVRLRSDLAHRRPPDRFAELPGKFPKQHVEIVSVELIKPVKCNVPKAVLDDVRFDRQQAPALDDAEGPIDRSSSPGSWWERVPGDPDG